MDASPVSVTPTQVANLVSLGVKTGEIIRLLVALEHGPPLGLRRSSRRSRNSLTT